jgi:hypothetical protein
MGDDNENPPLVTAVPTGNPAEPSDNGSPEDDRDQLPLEDEGLPGPRRSMRMHAPSAAGTTSKGIACDGPMDQVGREAQESAERKRAEKEVRKEIVNVVEEEEDGVFLPPTEADDP